MSTLVKPVGVMHVEFDDECFVFNIRLDVQMEDGTIASVVELKRNARKK